MTNWFHQAWLTLSRYISTFHQSQLELSGNMWFNFVEMKTPNIPLQWDFQPSIYNERERRRGDAAHPGFDFLWLFSSSWCQPCRCLTSWTPGRSTSWSGRRWRPKKPPGGLRQRRNFVTTVILVMLARLWCGPSEIRAKPGAARPPHTARPATDKYLEADSWNISSSQRRRLTDPLIKALMCGVISDRSVERGCSNLKIKLLLAAKSLLTRGALHCALCQSQRKTRSKANLHYQRVNHQNHIWSVEKSLNQNIARVDQVNTKRGRLKERKKELQCCPVLLSIVNDSNCWSYLWSRILRITSFEDHPPLS